MAGSRSVNKVILVGNLGRDAETKFTPSGVARTTFSIATTRRFKDQQTGDWKDITDWHNIVLWRSENVANYLTKGKQVYVEGRLESRSYDDKDGNKRYVTDVVCEEVILLGGRGDAPSGGGGGGGDYGGVVSMPRSSMGGGGGGNAPRSTPAQSSEQQFPDVVSDDDVPF
jgi:single-strand DNA-binding protein